MPTKDAIRVAIALKQYQFDRLIASCEEQGVSRNHLITAICTVMTKNELTDILRRYEQVQALEKELRVTADKELLKYIRGKTPKELQSMLDAAKATGGKDE